MAVKVTTKPLRRKKRRASGGKMSEPEKIVRAIQGVAAAAMAVHKVVKPYLKKIKKKKLKPKEVTHE